MKAEKVRQVVVTVLIALAIRGQALAAWTEPVPVDQVNTQYDEWAPFLSFDGLSLYFGRLYTDSYFYARIYEARRDEPTGPFTSVTEVLKSTGRHLLSPWVSPDNLRMYYHEEGPTWKLKMSERASATDAWPQGADIGELCALGNVAGPSLTADESIIFFCSKNIAGGQGDFDIWTAVRPDRSSPFANVRNLTEINTGASEGAPSISTDGLTLYFDSGPNGAIQLFKTTREALDQPFGLAEHLSFLDTPGGHSAAPSMSSGGTILHFNRFLSGEPRDIWVSYWTQDGLVGHWKFDEGSGTTAYDSAGTNNGTLVNGPVWTSGKIAGALRFDGIDDYVRVNDDPSLDGMNALALTAWLKTVGSGIDTGVIHKYLHFDGDNWNDSFFLSLKNDGKITFSYSLGNTQVVKTSSTVVDDDCWHQIVGIYTGSKGSIYIDGNQAPLSRDDPDPGGPINDSNQDLLIGCANAAGTLQYFFDGEIDDVRVYNRALSAEEVRQLYGGEPPGITATYYVDGVNGSDSNDGSTLETAFATIQKGIDEANDGDTVLVYPAVYQQAIDFDGKAITVQGVATAAGVPVLETPMDYAVSFYTAEGSDSVLKNFVIRNSFRAAFIAAASPTLSNLTVVDNDFGIAAYAGSQPDISNCIFYNNTDGDLFQCQALYSWTQQGAATLTEGLVSCWNFDEGSGTTAYDSAGTNNGTLVNGPVWTTGKIAGALSFDGINDYVALPNNTPIWLPQNDFTAACWVYFDKDPTSTAEFILDLQWSCWSVHELNTGYGIFRNAVDGKVKFAMETASADDDLRSEDVLAKNRWYHVVAVRYGTTQAIYLDGQLNASRTCSGEPIKFVGSGSDYKVNFGRVSNVSETLYYLDGMIDDVRIYDRALSAEEVRELYEYAPGAMFADAAGGDYHLKSERGRYWPAHDVWVLDDVTSACVDGGDPAANPGQERTPNGGRINMGAYGGTAYASMSEWPIPEDNNRDGIVNMLDFAMLADKWLQQLDWAE
ncbi:MAG TPA: LamG domain-containing protein [Sedimentisphaerales bacterium]|nr:LamG domain-containing protein [Sedimentisphaerales bacterium]